MASSSCALRRSPGPTTARGSRPRPRRPRRAQAGAAALSTPPLIATSVRLARRASDGAPSPAAAPRRGGASAASSAAWRCAGRRPPSAAATSSGVMRAASRKSERSDSSTTALPAARAAHPSRRNRPRPPAPLRPSPPPESGPRKRHRQPRHAASRRAHRARADRRDAPRASAQDCHSAHQTPAENQARQGRGPRRPLQQASGPMTQPGAGSQAGEGSSLAFAGTEELGLLSSKLGRPPRRATALPRAGHPSRWCSAQRERPARAQARA